MITQVPQDYKYNRVIPRTLDDYRIYRTEEESDGKMPNLI